MLAAKTNNKILTESMSLGCLSQKKRPLFLPLERNLLLKGAWIDIMNNVFTIVLQKIQENSSKGC